MSVRTKDMTSGNPAKLIISFALPLMIGNIFQQLYTMVDAIVVGNAIGVQALAALGATDWPVWLIIGMVSGFGQGFAIPIARHYGSGDYGAIRKVVTSAVMLSGALAVVLTAVALVAIRPLLQLLNTPTEILGDASLYATIIFACLTAQMAYNLLAAILRAIGNSRTPLIAIAIASVSNIVLDIVFVVFFGWGIAGAAVATVIAQCLSAVICFLAVRKTAFLRIHKEDLRLDKPVLSQLLRLGTPLAFQNVLIAVGGFVVQNIVNGYGMVFIAGFTATSKLEGLLSLAATAFGYSMVTYVGQNLGAKKWRRVRTGVRSAALLGLATAALISTCMLIFGQSIVSLFISDSPEIKERAIGVAYSFLKIMSYFLPVLYMLHIFRSALYGFGDTVVPMVSGIVELVMRVSVILTLPRLIGENGVFLAETAAWVGAAVILIATFCYRASKLPRMGE